MNLLLAALVGLLAGLGSTIALILRQISTKGQLPATAEWIEELSVDRYRPMLRLLDKSDLDFLKSQPGFNPNMAARLRKHRCQIFAGYLKCLDADFKRTCSALKLLMIQSHYDRRDLASDLIRAQMKFALGIVIVRFRVTLYRFGLAGVDVRGLVKLFDGLRVELRTVVPAGSMA
jgi:hypothetical protein